MLFVGSIELTSRSNFSNASTRERTLKISVENWGFPTVGTTFPSCAIATAREVPVGKHPLTVATVPPTRRRPGIKPGCGSRNERTRPSHSRNWPGSPKRSSKYPLARLLLFPRFDMVRPYHLRWIRPLGLGRVAGGRLTLSYSTYDSGLEKGNLITCLRMAGENAQRAAFTQQRETETHHFVQPSEEEQREQITT